MFLELGSSTGSELISELSEGVGVRQRIVFNRCETKSDVQEWRFYQAPNLSHFSCVDKCNLFVALRTAPNLGD